MPTARNAQRAMPSCIAGTGTAMPPAASPASRPRAVISSGRTDAGGRGDFAISVGQTLDSFFDLRRRHTGVRDAKRISAALKHEVRTLDELQIPFGRGAEQSVYVG